MQLRNCILIALAFDASQQEIDQAHSLIDRVFDKNGPIDASYVVTASVPPDAPRTTDSAAAQVDADGLPWDERIHSSSKALTDKGVWRARRNLDPAFKKKIEAELRGAIKPIADMVKDTNEVAASVAPPAPAPAPAPAAPNLPPMPGASTAATIDPNYTELVKVIAANTHSTQNPTGRINDAWVTQVIQHFGVPDGSLQSLAHSPEKTLEVLNAIKTALGL